MLFLIIILGTFRCYFMASNIIEIQHIKIARYSNKGYFPGEHFYILEKLNNQYYI